jgi:curved DNA-binding protein CbpA
MIFQGDMNYYEVLEIAPGCSPQEVRAAYLKLRAAYRKDNPALYSVLDPQETEDMVAKIEEAFHVLSDPDARREYDERNGFSQRMDRKIHSIDRATQNADTPFGSAADIDDPLVAPTTDFRGMGESQDRDAPTNHLPTQTPSPFGPFTSTPDPESQVRNPFFDRLPGTPAPASAPQAQPTSQSFVDRRQSFGRRESDSSINPQADIISSEIAGETEWRGPTLRRIRELRRYSLDDVAQITKISKTYLQAIEEELYDKLPAPVFVRGFLLQLAKTLKIPTEPVAQAYMARYRKRPEF